MAAQDTIRSVAIVGGGIGGFTTAQELRRGGFDGPITIIDPEGMPYDRPPLTKQYLAGNTSAEALRFVDEGWYRDAGVDLVQARAERVLPSERSVVLDGAARIQADSVVLATGGAPRVLDVPGACGPAVMSLRVRRDADRLRENLSNGEPLVIVGAGLIGAEVASTAADRGVPVTLIDPASVPLVPAVGRALAERLQAMHDDAGVTTLTGSVTAIVEHDGVATVTVDGLPGGATHVTARTVLVAIGIVPTTMLAVSAGLDIDGGVLVDRLQRTSNPAIYAVGDAARQRAADGTLLRRHEHWESAMNQGRTAAAALLGGDLPTHGAPWFWSDRYGVHVEAVGSMLAPGRDVLRLVDGVPNTAFRVGDDDRLMGCAAIDQGPSVRAARRIIDRRIAVDEDQLADPTIPLKKLAK